MEVTEDINLIINYIKNKNYFDSDKEVSSEDRKHILIKINKVLKNESYEEIFLNDEIYKQYNVEHIMPQSSLSSNIAYWKNNLENYYEEHKNEFENINQVHDKFIDQWGNLTLLNQKDNSKIGNKDFQQKKKTIQQSSFQINRFVIEKNDWKIEDIIERQKLFLEIFKNNF